MDMIKFAMLISYFSSLTNSTLECSEIERIRDLVKDCIQDSEEVRQRAVSAINELQALNNNIENIDILIKSMKENKKIEAIKAYRTMTGLGLKESKDAVERMMDVPSYDPSKDV